MLYHMSVYNWNIFFSLCSYLLLLTFSILVSHGRERWRFRLNERISVPNRLRLCPFHSVAGFRRTIRFPVTSQTNIRSSQYWFCRSCFSAFGFPSSSHISCNNGSVPWGNLCPCNKSFKSLIYVHIYAHMDIYVRFDWTLMICIALADDSRLEKCTVSFKNSITSFMKK